MVKILWVDDEVELLKPHVLFLKQKGYEVDTCNNGYDAIDMASEGAYDLIILDEMMPGMTGLETLPKIKAVSYTHLTDDQLDEFVSAVLREERNLILDLLVQQHRSQLGRFVLQGRARPRREYAGRSAHRP